jgi:toxin ParE1/3/4
LRVTYSDLARRDLASIKAWSTQAFGSRQAAAYIRQIKYALQVISENPGLARDASHVGQGLRKTFSGSHTISLRISDKAIKVARILHAKMEPELWM